MGAGSHLHPIRVGMSLVSKERLGTCSSATSWLDSGPNPSKRLLILVKSSFILAAKSKRMEITLATLGSPKNLQGILGIFKVLCRISGVLLSSSEILRVEK